jgi:hypothetical protein
MPSEMLIAERYELSDDAFAFMRVWEVGEPLAGCTHRFKYSLVLVVKGKCVLRYDNEAGKGDHRHRHGKETAYPFTTLDQLQVDFWSDVNKEFPE